MIVWINGTFGVGKTTTAQALHDRTGWPRFDPEHVGFLLMSNLRDVEFDDFQELPPWRRLVPAIADELLDVRQVDTLITPQTVLIEAYWDELLTGFQEQGHDVFHVVLDADEATLRDRIEHDTEEAQAKEWRLDHLAAYAGARPWLTNRADLVIDTAAVAPAEIAAAIASALG